MPVSWLLLNQDFGSPANVALQNSENCQVVMTEEKWRYLGSYHYRLFPGRAPEISFLSQLR